MNNKKEQAQKQEPVAWSWVCNECGSREFTSAVSESDLKYLSCYGCGCDEFHKDIAPPQQKQEPVAVVSQNSTGQIALMKPNGDAFDVSKHLGQSFYTTPPPLSPLTDEKGRPMTYWGGMEQNQEPVIDTSAAIRIATVLGWTPPQQKQEPVAHRHKWDKSGERCVKCGDKDWMGGSCRVSDASIYTSPPPLQPEPVIDKSAAIRIATALGWTPPRQPLTEQRIQQIWFDNLDGIISFEECVTVIREAEEAHGIGEKK